MASEAFQVWIDRLRSARGVELVAITDDIERGFGPADVLAVPDLVDALGDAHANVRFGAAIALGSIGSGAAQAVPSLLRALRDADGQVRHDAATALGRIDPGNPKVIRGLLRLLLDDDDDVQAAAEEALSQISPDSDGPEAKKARRLLRIAYDRDPPFDEPPYVD